MLQELKPGLTGTAETVVRETNTALAMGKKVTAKATLTAVEGRKLIFEITAADEDKQIGKGTHERFIVNKEKFMAKLG